MAKRNDKIGQPIHFCAWTLCLGVFFCGGSVWAEPDGPAVTDAASIKTEPNLLSLYSYKPIYFLVGSPYTKIQLSFETQIFKNIPIYFGYSQLMLWDLLTPSPFFYDLNYNPLFWYRLVTNDVNSEWLDFIPWEHESNGKGGSSEISWDRVGVLYHRTDSVGANMQLYQDYKVWVPLDYNSNSTDLARYRGLWELNLTLSGLFKPYFAFDDITLRLYPGGPSLLDPTMGGQELTLRLRSSNRMFLPFVTLQVFHGYGEYLQDYSVDQWGLRAGLGF